MTRESGYDREQVISMVLLSATFEVIQHLDQCIFNIVVSPTAFHDHPQSSTHTIRYISQSMFFQFGALHCIELN